MQRGAVEARQAHNLKVVGSNPTAVTNTHKTTWGNTKDRDWVCAWEGPQYSRIWFDCYEAPILVQQQR